MIRVSAFAMKWSAAALCALSTVVLLGVSEPTYGETATDLLAREAVLNDKCRDGTDKDLSYLEACKQRDKVSSELFAMGWCWGEPDQFEAEKEWHKCTADPSSRAGAEETPKAGTASTAGQSENAAEKTFVAKLREKYGTRLSFSSQRGEEIVEDFAIDCHRPDRRFLPLMNVLFSQMAMMDMANTWLTVEVENRDDEVRIYEILQDKKGPISQRVLIFDINKWNELSVHDIQAGAVMNECLGSSGPLWETP
jgi:hypothetical protein